MNRNTETVGRLQRYTFLGTLAAAIMAVSTAGPASARDMEKYFAGKTITVIAPSSPGGGSDFNVRLFARYASKYFPGKPRFIVQNIKGGGQLKGLQKGMRAKPDGFTGVSLNPRWAIRSILGQKLGPFDIRTTRIVGSPIAAGRAELVCTDRKHASSWKEVLANKKKMTYPAEPGGRSDFGPLLVAEVGGPIRNISGYAGVSEETAAFNRGELTSIGCNEATVPRLFPEWIKEKRLVPLFWWDAESSPEYLKKLGFTGKVPNLLDLPGVNFPKEARVVTDVAMKIFSFTRAIVLPPKTPDDIYQVWVKAYEATHKDPELIATGAKGGLEIRVGHAADFQKALAAFKTLSPKGRKLFEKIMVEAR